jgi:hypothetical protein
MPRKIKNMKGGYIFLCSFVILTAWDCRSKNRKAADEISAKMAESTNMNVGKQNYSLYIPEGWTTEYRTVYGIDYYYLLAPKTEQDPNTSINVITEYMQNFSLSEFRDRTIESVKMAIPSASNFTQGFLTANGLAGSWYSYTMEPQGIKATLVCYIFPKDGIAYSITAGTSTKNATHYRRLFDSVARSFRFLELVPANKKPLSN